MRYVLRSLLVIGAALSTPSCLGLGGQPPNISRHSIHLFDMEPACAEPVFPSLAVRLFEGRQRYAARVLLRDETDGSIHYLEDERWVEDPQDALTDVVREALAQSGAFEVVAPATSGFTGAYILDGTVLECDLVRSTTGPWRARLALRLDAARVENSEMLNAAVYRAERELPGQAARGVGQAITECAKEIVAAAVRDWLANADASARLDGPREDR